MEVCASQISPWEHVLSWRDTTTKKMVSVIEIKVAGAPQVEKALGVNPALETVIPVDFGEAVNCAKEGILDGEIW
ncbi:MAG: hypothetical protein K0S24_4060 [Sphingobacterium sp.]|jgi:hypothetical protein|nr:hypothetical protein [Sphingobacterium sp.]